MVSQRTHFSLFFLQKSQGISGKTAVKYEILIQVRIRSKFSDGDMDHGKPKSLLYTENWKLFM